MQKWGKFLGTESQHLSKNKEGYFVRKNHLLRKMLHNLHNIFTPEDKK